MMHAVTVGQSVWAGLGRRSTLPGQGTPIRYREETRMAWAIAGGSWGSDFAPPPVAKGVADVRAVTYVTGIA